MASKTKIYIVLEFVTGGELFDKIVRWICLKLTCWIILHVNVNDKSIFFSVFFAIFLELGK
jgi:hypothetical protein